MGLFYSMSDKKLLEIRNKIFNEKGIPALEKNEFKQSPFSTSWYGKDDLGGYSYEFCRLSKTSHLQLLFVDIIKGDRWIQMHLNIFKLLPELNSIAQLQGLSGLQYHLPPNSLGKMRLRIDDYKGIPLFRTKEHRLKSFNTENGLKLRVRQLEKLIEKDLQNIDSFIERWHELHQPNLTDWEGNKS